MKNALSLLGIFLVQLVHLTASDATGFEGRSDSISISDYAENPLINYYLKIKPFFDGYQQSKTALDTGIVPKDLEMVLDNALKAGTDFVNYYEKNRLQTQNKLPFVVALASTLKRTSSLSKDTISKHDLIINMGSDPSRYLLSAVEIGAYCDVMRRNRGE